MDTTLGGFRSLRAWLTTGVLIVLSLGWALLASPLASAGLRDETEVVPGSASANSGPMVLASTGLDITIPIIVGLSVLMLGTIMVGCVFLATGRRGHR